MNADPDTIFEALRQAQYAWYVARRFRSSIIWVRRGRGAAHPEDMTTDQTTQSTETRQPRVLRRVTERGVRYPSGRVATGANISDHIVPGEIAVERQRTVYEDDVTEWVPSIR